MTHHLCRDHGLTRFRHRPRPTCHTAAGFPVHVFHPLAGRAPSTTCFIRDSVTTEWTCGLWLWGFRRRSCRPFQALVMVKSIHGMGGHSCVCAASTFGLKSESRLARLSVASNTVKATGLLDTPQAALTPLFAVSRGSVYISRPNSAAVCRQHCWWPRILPQSVGHHQCALYS